KIQKPLDVKRLITDLTKSVSGVFPKIPTPKDVDLSGIEGSLLSNNEGMVREFKNILARIEKLDSNSVDIITKQSGQILKKLSSDINNFIKIAQQQGDS
ncbi:MAG: hypothetical protein IIC84_02475, partial [Chloroflexi bacterium]|nr:hypothetical protein [Chloroflexota bacterium]